MSRKQSASMPQPNAVPDKNTHEIPTAALLRGNRVAEAPPEASATPPKSVPRKAAPDSKRGQIARIKEQEEKIQKLHAELQDQKNLLAARDSRIEELSRLTEDADVSSSKQQSLRECATKYRTCWEFEADGLDDLDGLEDTDDDEQSWVTAHEYAMERLDQVFHAKYHTLWQHDVTKITQLAESYHEKENKSLIIRLHERIAELEAVNERQKRIPAKDMIDQLVHKRFDELMENHNVELRDAYEAAFVATTEGQRTADKDTIARLQSRVADLEAALDQTREITASAVEQFGQLMEEYDAETRQKVEERNIMLMARLQEKMDNLDAAFERVANTEDKAAQGADTAVGSETKAEAGKKESEGRCIVS